MKRILNFRLIVFIASSVLLGIALCYYLPSLKIMALILPVGIYALLYCLSEVFYREVAPLKRLVIIIVGLFFVFCGCGRFYISVLRTDSEAVAAGEYNVVGTVDKVAPFEGEMRIILKNCEYDGEGGGNLCVYGFSGNVEKGDIIEVKCKAHAAPMISENSYSYYACENISMISNGAELIKNNGQKRGLFPILRNKAKGLVYTDSSTVSAIALALFMGDTSKLSQDELSSFRAVGIAHVFAVSGMHVGLLYFALAFIFKRLKIKRWISLIVITLMLFGYVGVCGFTASALRAGIMCVMSEIGNTLGEKKDRLNNLAVAAVIIAFTSVGDVVGVGFILSFTVCLSIIILSPMIERCLSFLGKKFSSALSVLIAAEISSLPICIAYFGYFPIIAVLTNLLLIPIITFCYYLIWIGVLINLILPFLNFGLYLPKIMITGLYRVTDLLGETKAIISRFSVVYLVAYYPLLFISSDIVNCKMAVKTVSFITVISIIAISAILSLAL